MESYTDESDYPPELIEISRNAGHFGRMNAPTSSAYVKGPCGDEMESYLEIADGVIEDIRFYSEGCTATRICGEMTARMASGKKIDEALAISPAAVKSRLKGLPEDHEHCSILAVSTLYKAIAEYLLMP